MPTPSTSAARAHDERAPSQRGAVADPFCVWFPLCTKTPCASRCASIYFSVSLPPASCTYATFASSMLSPLLHQGAFDRVTFLFCTRWKHWPQTTPTPQRAAASHRPQLCRRQTHSPPTGCWLAFGPTTRGGRTCLTDACSVHLLPPCFATVARALCTTRSETDEPFLRAMRLRRRDGEARTQSTRDLVKILREQ